jgi:hypothetical protein
MFSADMFSPARTMIGSSSFTKSKRLTTKLKVLKPEKSSKRPRRRPRRRWAAATTGAARARAHTHPDIHFYTYTKLLHIHAPKHAPARTCTPHSSHTDANAHPHINTHMCARVHPRKRTNKHTHAYAHMRTRPHRLRNNTHLHRHTCTGATSPTSSTRHTITSLVIPSHLLPHYQLLKTGMHASGCQKQDGR